MRMLLADDDLELLDLIADALDQPGTELVRASSGAELQQALAAGEAFDVVVTDVSMPPVTGVDILRAARATGVSYPTVVITALRRGITLAQIAELGDRVTLLYKPFSISALRAALRTCQGLAA
jgi:DNA-binding response OmpR family regulator